MVNRVVSDIKRSKLRETRRKWEEKLKQIDVTKLKVVRQFSKGSQAHVSLVQLDDDPNSAFALKTIPKAKIKTELARNNIFSEKKILSEVESEFVIKMYKTFKDKKFLYILTEYCPGGDLLYNRRRFSEDVAKFYIACTVEAIDCLHSMDIVHNDIKPANIVLDDEGYARLIDMGLAEEIQRGKKQHTFCGSLYYMAPELSRIYNCSGFDGKDRAVDLWALGIMLYKLLDGSYPFEGRDRRMLCMYIERGIGSVQFSEKYFSAEAADFIRRLCAYEPEERLGYESIDEIRNHRWFAGFNWADLRNRRLKPPEIPHIESPVDTHHFRETVRCNLDAAVEDASDWDMDF